MNKQRIVCLLACMLLAVKPVSALDALKAEKFTLDNGLEVQVLHQPKAPIVTHMLWFFAGGADEPAGKSGVAHFLEHMMFKGTPKHPAGEYEALLERMGGQQNAFTTDDYTAYYATVAKEYLPQVMALESDRFMHIAPAPSSYKGELEVVKEERRMRTDNNPEARLYEALQARLLAPHPYATPVIGWMQEVARLSQRDVLDFFHKHYGPKNAILLLVGDVTLAQAKQLAQKYYGGWKSNAVRAQRTWPEPQPLNRAVSLSFKDGNVSQLQWQRQYIAPSLDYGDRHAVFPLIVLTQVMCGSEASALYQQLVVKERKLTSLSCGYDAFARGPGSMRFEMIPAQGVSVAEATHALESAIAVFLDASEPVDALRRAKNSLKVETIYARDGISGMASIFGQLMMLGLGVDFFNDWPQAVSAVQWDAMQRYGREVFTQHPHATGWIEPDPTQPKTHAVAPQHAVEGGAHVR